MCEREIKIAFCGFLPSELQHICVQYVFISYRPCANLANKSKHNAAGLVQVAYHSLTLPSTILSENIRTKGSNKMFSFQLASTYCVQNLNSIMLI